MVGGRPDWCVSRQRSWGVGIPAFYCTDCGTAILTKESVGAVVALVEREGSDVWYERTPEEILPDGFACFKCGADKTKLRKETDVLDVWFDSGSTNRAVLENPAHWPDLAAPAEVYLEGGDQHRGWFNSSLMIAAATRGRAPYRQVVTNGWTLDEKGHAMHKSLGNVISPHVVTEKYGAEIVRLWVASQNFMEDTRCGENVLKQVSEMYRRIRNTFRFLVNNLYDFDPAVNAVPTANMEELDQWVIEQLGNIVVRSTEAYEKYEFHRVYQEVLNFCSVELSAFYLDVIKDRLYASGKDWKARRSAQTALHTLAETLARLLAPVLPHTAEEVWDYLKLSDKAESIHLSAFPEGQVGTKHSQHWLHVLAARERVKKGLEEARQQGKIGNPLKAHVTLNVVPLMAEKLKPFEAQLPSLFLVSQVEVNVHKRTGEADFADLDVNVAAADGPECARCWLVKTDVGVNAAYPELCGRCADAMA